MRLADCVARLNKTENNQYEIELGTLDLRRDCLSLTVEAEKPIGFVTETQMYRCGILNRQCYQWMLVNIQQSIPSKIVKAKAAAEVIKDEAAYYEVAQ